MLFLSVGVLTAQKEPQPGSILLGEARFVQQQQW
jgi:hypothetical protein